MSILGAIAGIATAAGLSALSSSQQNKANKKLQVQAFGQSMYASNTAHQREVQDLKAAGLNPILSANGGASAPTATASEYQSPISSALDRAIQTAYAKEELTSLHHQNRQLKFDSDYLDEYGSLVKANRLAIDNAAVATALSQERNSMLEGDILALDRDLAHYTYGKRKALVDYQHDLAKNNAERDNDLRAWERAHPDLVNAGRSFGSIKPMVDTGLNVTGMWLNRRNSARTAALADRNTETARQRLMFDVRRYEEGKRRR